MLEEERIKRSFSDQIRNLTAERSQLQQILQQRSLSTATEFVDGLAFLLAAAAAGDPGARQTLQQLKQLFRQLEALSTLVVVNGS